MALESAIGYPQAPYRRRLEDSASLNYGNVRPPSLLNVSLVHTDYHTPDLHRRSRDIGNEEPNGTVGVPILKP